MNDSDSLRNGVPAPKTAEIIVASTHLDDAVFSCYSVLSSGVTVMTVLAGVPPQGVLGSWDAEGGALDSHERVLNRREKDERALLLTGSTPMHLDFHEGQHWGLAGMRQPTLEELAEGVRQQVEDASVVYAPAGIWNAEHKLVRDAVLAVRPDAVLYADLPYALRADMGGFELPAEVSSHERQRREELLDPAHAAMKVESSRCYASQLRQVAIFGDFLNVNDLSREVFWELAPPSAVGVAAG